MSTVSLNIKNERVHALARRAAARAGKSQTAVIEEALRRYLDEMDRAGETTVRDEQIRDLLADLDALVARGVQIPANSDFLYDEHGLPA